MQKLLISLTVCATLVLAACSLPGVYKIDVQQGNVITQDMVDQLQPGMDKRKVRFVMGTPLLVDVFHQERWDYIYSLQPGGEARKQERVSLYFEDDKLSRVEGDYRPNPLAAGEQTSREVLVIVPVLPPEKKGFLDRLLGRLGFEDEVDREGIGKPTPGALEPESDIEKPEL